MVGEDKELSDLEKLLADVKRTIRDNDQFIRHLKDESADDSLKPDEEPENVDSTDDVEYEEL